MTYLDLFRAHGATVAFGFALAFLSSFGQTYFIALSVPDLRAAYGLSHGGFGTVYSVATLASGLLMTWVGATLDRVTVQAYAAVSLAGLAAAALTLSLAPNVAVLGLALFALRLFGQGTLSHAAVTSTARLPEGIRGRAVGFATLGFQVGTAVLPAAGIALIATIGWVVTWQAVAAALAVCVASVALLRLPDEGAGERTAAAGPQPAGPGQRRRDLLRDWRFLAYVPTMMGPAAIITGYFFHQRYLADDRGWGLELLAAGITVSAIASVLSSVGSGSLVDRFGAVRMSRWHLLPLAAASLVLAVPSGPAGALLFFALMGVTSGANSVVVTAALAELYGTRQLGMIRALAGAVMVVASAVTPGLFGFALDYGIGLAAIAATSGAYLVLASALNLSLRATRRG